MIVVEVRTRGEVAALATMFAADAVFTAARNSYRAGGDSEETYLAAAAVHAEAEAAFEVAYAAEREGQS